MQQFTRLTGVVAPLDSANVDTDQIIPKQFLKRVERSGFGQFAFYNQRFDQNGDPVPGFVLNQPRYQGASILLARENFGSGSSREHAPWALLDYGFRVVIAPSFADIFHGNAFNNGMLLIRLPQEQVSRLFELAAGDLAYELTVDLEACTIGGDGFQASFQIDPFLRQRLLEGLDNIGLTLRHADLIDQYEKSHARPWQAAISA